MKLIAHRRFQLPRLNVLLIWAMSPLGPVPVRTHLMVKTTLAWWNQNSNSGFGQSSLHWSAHRAYVRELVGIHGVSVYSPKFQRSLSFSCLLLLLLLFSGGHFKKTFCFEKSQASTEAEELYNGPNLAVT